MKLGVLGQHGAQEEGRGHCFSSDYGGGSGEAEEAERVGGKGLAQVLEGRAAGKEELRERAKTAGQGDEPAYASGA